MGIKEILFLNNQLTGCIPQGVGMWADLQVLDVSSNSLMGHLPDSLSCLSAIEVLNVAHNKLSGELPDLVCSLRRLLNLTVAANFFSGLSQDCDNLFFRNVGFDFSLNCIPGKEMQRPEPDCSAVPGGGLSCLRIPSARPFVCGTLLGAQITTTHDLFGEKQGKFLSDLVRPNRNQSNGKCNTLVMFGQEFSLDIDNYLVQYILVVFSFGMCLEVGSLSGTVQSHSSSLVLTQYQKKRKVL
ncbi:UNVERIFIED_CONTAM: hypothetical protein Slati_3646200 [Sesamum latifolium]|uniref:Uncharacterized protein n=1 Tax=Sesamum latifolium TaxID=2727402 RepID=A0AAW2U1Z4_9LAMI